MRDIDNSTANESFVIFSSKYLGTNTFLSSALIGHKWIEGAWQGKREDAWLVNAKDFATVRAHAKVLRGEECVLHLGPIDELEEARPASLEYLERQHSRYESAKPRESIGYFRQVSQAEAEASPGYTRDGDTFYLAK